MIIGVTGYYGCGKTTVSKMLKGFIVNVDEITYEVLAQGTNEYNKVVKEFGKEILENEHINRTKLAEIVFNDENKLKKLENITHPVISQIAKDLVENCHQDLIVIDCAILEKLKLDKICDNIVLVESTSKTISQRSDLTHEEIVKRMKHQNFDTLEAIKIKNNGSLEELQETINSFLGNLV